MHWSTLEEVNVALWTQKLKHGAPTLSCVFLLYPFVTDVIVIIQNPLHSLFTPPHPAVWLQPESHGLLVGHPFDLDVAEAFVLGAEKRSKLNPPVGYPNVLLHVWVDSLNSIVWVSLNPLPGFCCLLGRVVARYGHGRWRRRGTRSISSLNGFHGLSINLLWELCGFRDLWASQQGCGLGGLQLLRFLTQEGGFLLWSRGGSMSYACVLQKWGLYHFISTEVHQGGHASLEFSHWITYNSGKHPWPFCADLSVQCSVQTKARVFSCLMVLKSFVPEALVWGMNPRDIAHWARVGHPTIPRLCVGHGAAWRLPPAIGQSPSPCCQWSTPLKCVHQWRSSHYLWFLSTSRGGLWSCTSLLGPIGGGGSPDLVPLLSLIGISMEQWGVWWGPSARLLLCRWDGAGGLCWEAAMGNPWVLGSRSLECHLTF